MKNQFFIELNFLFIVSLIKKIVIGVLLHMQLFYTPVNHTLQFLYIDTFASRDEKAIVFHFAIHVFISSSSVKFSLVLGVRSSSAFAT